MPITRRNHYLPQWYQKRFLLSPNDRICRLDLSPDKITLPDGGEKTLNTFRWLTPAQCYFERDLYTTTFLGFDSDLVERYLFGTIDQNGAKAIAALIKIDLVALHDLFNDLFFFLDALKLRTPKGLEWIRSKYLGLTQHQLMHEMEQLRRMHCTMWVEAVREIVSAEESEVKFIITDHPVTIYNPQCPPSSKFCNYPNDPPISLKGSQTIFPLDLNHCLILTNLEYAENPLTRDLLVNRTNARSFGNTISRIDAMIRSRKLSEDQVVSINYIMKARARRYISAARREWLNPESSTQVGWKELGNILLPPKDELHHFGGEVFIGYENGTVHYQDAFGRTTKEWPFLKKPEPKGKVGANEPCICGSGKKYKQCCRGKDPADIPLTNERSIRERNLMFIRIVGNILGLNQGKDWDDVRKTLSDEQVKAIFECVEALWPKDTNIVALLPRFDDRVLRGLYCGLIDPRTILQSVAGPSAYFDEMLVMSPFVNPTYMKPEYSPIHSPGKFKQQTLKNVLLLFMLEPFIRMGSVNLIPDPCSLNLGLQKQIWDMAETRLKGFKPESEDVKNAEKLMREDFNRTVLGLPDDNLRKIIKAAVPGIDEEDIEETLLYMRQKQLEDPLALLQTSFSREGEGQFMITQISPNFELGFFLAQLTGSLIFTDNPHRWKEVTRAEVQPDNDTRRADWDRLSKIMEALPLVYENDVEVNLLARKREGIVAMRRALRRICVGAQRMTDPSTTSTLVSALSEDFTGAHKKALKEWETIKRKWTTSEQTFGKVHYAIPPNGFAANTVQRLLLSYGNVNYLTSVPMAMYLEIST